MQLFIQQCCTCISLHLTFQLSHSSENKTLQHAVVCMSRCSCWDESASISDPQHPGPSTYAFLSQKWVRLKVKEDGPQIKPSTRSVALIQKYRTSIHSQREAQVRDSLKMLQFLYQSCPHVSGAHMRLKQQWDSDRRVSATPNPVSVHSPAVTHPRRRSPSVFISK